MKQAYEAPLFEVETYELDASIASNCTIVVTNGPAVGNHEQCSDYKDPFEMSVFSYEKQGGPYNVQFYEDTNCDCYYSSKDGGYWTS